MARRARSLSQAAPPTRHLEAPSTTDRADTPEQREADKIRWSRRWRALRAVVLSKDPMCRACKAAGRERAATQVDHIEPLVVSIRAGRPLMAFTASNLQALCTTCHAAKSVEERR